MPKWLCILLLLGFNNCFAQQTYTDSLYRIIRDPETDAKTKILAGSELANVIRYHNEPEALKLAQEGVRLAQREDALYKVYAYEARSAVYLSMKQNEQASADMDSSLHFSTKTNDARARSWVHYQMARMLSYQEKTREALPMYLKALEFIKGKGYPELEARIYYGLYTVFSTWEDLDNEDKYALLALNAAKQSKDPNRECEAWQAVATAVEYRYLQKKDKVLLDSMIQSLRNSINIYLQNEGRMHMIQLITIPCINLANAYNMHFPVSPQTTDSLRHYAMLAFNYASKDKDTRLQAASFGLMNEDAKRNGNYALAETYLQQALTLVKNDPNPDNDILASIQRDLAEVAEKRKEYARALQYQKDYMATYRSIYDAEQARSGKDIEAKYEAKEKEHQIQFLKKSEELNRRQKYLYSGIALALLLVLIFMFRSYHFRLRYSMQKEKMLEQEKEEARLLALLKEEETQLLESEKQKAELHAQLLEEQARLKAEETARLQAEQLAILAQKELLHKEVLAGSLHVEQKNKVLQELKDKLREHPGKEIGSTELNHILKQQQHLDSEFDAFKTELKEVHPGFYRKLQSKAGDNLTALDLKYCAYLYLKRSTKEIAQLLGVEPKSVRMTKYRIKQKLGLKKEEDLEQYIEKEDWESMA